MEYRSRERILYEILKSLSEEKTKLQTHVMYQCRLSHAQLKAYTELIVLNKLAVKVDTAMAITEEGRDMLKILDKIFSMKLILPS